MSAALQARDAVDLNRLPSWLNAYGVGSGPITDATILTGGTQNVLIRFRRGDQEMVVRRPLARAVLRGYEPDHGVFPDHHLLRLRKQAKTKYAEILNRHR